MSSLNYGQVYSRKQTPQSEPIPGSKQVPNSAGGYAFAVDDWTRLDRFLILGTEGGSYYAKELALTRENAQAVERCIQADGQRAVARIAEISDAGRAPKNDPAIFALALAAKTGDAPTRKAALTALPKVCRIGTHLMHFAEYVQHLGGWGRGTRRAVANWYLSKPLDRLAYQLVKYQSRDTWSNRDLLRLSHAKPTNMGQSEILRWAAKGAEPGREIAPSDGYSLIAAFEQAKTAEPKELIRLIREHNLPHEAIPTEAKTRPEIWEALLPDLGMTALIRNLATMTRVGLLAPNAAAVRSVCERLEDAEQIKKARLHPLSVLVALNTYQRGQGVRGSGTWTPVQRIVDALDGAFYKAFQAVEPTGKRYQLAIDVSGSMSCTEIAGMAGITPRIGAATMALVTAAVEKEYVVTAFSSGPYRSMHSGMGYGSGIVEAKISPRMRLDSVIQTLAQIPMGGTDCALPMLWAAENKIPCDVFCVYTDSETWAGAVHPVQALNLYRQKTGIPAKLVVIGMVSNGFTIADPNDAGMLDVVGFDTATPAVISDFAGR